MTHLKQWIAFGIAVTVINFNGIYSQCDTCPPQSNEVDERLAKNYKEYFARIFRKTTEQQNTHSVSVDFSKQAINDFFVKNFNGGQYGDHEGINVHLISFGSVILPGHVHNNQIGLGISPTNADCESDFDAFNIVNNSFNQSRVRNNNTPYSNRSSKSLLEAYKSNYEFVHFNPDPNRHTKYVHFTRVLIETIYDFFQDGSNSGYKGVRFHFASYNRSDEACGQVSDEQITLLITPVRNNGDADYSAFYSFIKKKYSLKEKREKIMNTLNHGTLCPTQCPDED